MLLGAFEKLQLNNLRMRMNLTFNSTNFYTPYLIFFSINILTGNLLNEMSVVPGKIKSRLKRSIARTVIFSEMKMAPRKRVKKAVIGRTRLILECAQFKARSDIQCFRELKIA